MSKHQPSGVLQWLSLFLLMSLFGVSRGDVGTAAQYSPPYLPTACYGNNPAQFPSSNLFGAAGEGVWDNGASCGRQYLVRCTSAAVPNTCIPAETIQIRIVDRAATSVSRPSRNGATIVLSTTAFSTIANASADFINIEYLHYSSSMSKHQPSGVLQWLSLFLLMSLFGLSRGDVGTAAQYSPPYLPTACYGNNPAQFPSSNLFGAAGEGVWDNGASCGRQYLVRCISAAVPNTCIPAEIIQIRIVDRAETSLSRPSRNGATIVLSTTAFSTIANASANSINIEYSQ
ncbi:hypothetical protein LWI29_028923 [Acer saccharum]|uniref:Expansin-like EG45 domain-containing protein n=1 Tax=Acer saccharum TaxID=4024 RepID=A0AA39RED5_ACESA|nr:hypothetical protein LWI29_028923 [Acer saccharum]